MYFIILRRGQSLGRWNSVEMFKMGVGVLLAEGSKEVLKH